MACDSAQCTLYGLAGAVDASCPRLVFAYPVSQGSTALSPAVSQLRFAAMMLILRIKRGLNGYQAPDFKLRDAALRNLRYSRVPVLDVGDVAPACQRGVLHIGRHVDPPSAKTAVRSFSSLQRRRPPLIKRWTAATCAACDPVHEVTLMTEQGPLVAFECHLGAFSQGVSVAIHISCRSCSACNRRSNEVLRQLLLDLVMLAVGPLQLLSQRSSG